MTVRNSSRRRFIMVSRALTLWTLSVVIGVANADYQLMPHIAAYKIKISILGGEMRSRLERVNNEFVAESTTRGNGLAKLIAPGTLQEKSRFTILGSEIRPLEYQSADSLSKKGQDVEIRFDWQAKAIDGVADSVPFYANIEGYVLDRASLQYALMFDLLNDRVRQQYIIQEPQGPKKLSVTLRGGKSVKVPFGEFDVIGVSHSTGKSNRETILWCAPALGYVPIIIEQFRKKKLLGRVVLTSYESLEETPD